MLHQQGLPEGLPFQPGADPIEGTGDPGVEPKLVLELPGVPAGVTDEPEQAEGRVAGERLGFLPADTVA